MTDLGSTSVAPAFDSSVYKGFLLIQKLDWVTERASSTRPKTVEVEIDTVTSHKQTCLVFKNRIPPSLL